MSTADDPVGAYLTWLAVERGRATATVSAYRHDLARFTAWAAEQGRDPSTASEDELERYVGALRSELSDASLARNVSSLRGWFGFLVDEGVLDRDPTANLLPVRRGRSLPKPLGEQEMARLLDAIPSDTANDRRDRALLELLYGTGVRVSEAVGISLQDLDFDEELVRVTGKGSKQRLVPLGTVLRAALVEYLGPGGRGELLGPRRSSRLWLNARGGPLTRQGVDVIIARRALAAGVPRSRVSAHVFRHSCATHMLAHGADVRVVQELLGHASIATTQVYTAVSVTSLQRAYADAHPRAHG